MKKLTITLLILLTLSACQQEAVPPLSRIELKDIYSKGNGFEHNDFKWGMSLAEVEELSGLESYISERPTNRDGVGAWAQVGGQPPTKEYLTWIEDVKMFGRKEDRWRAAFSFNADELIMASFGIDHLGIDDNELWDFYYKTLEMLKQELGEPDRVVENDPPEDWIKSRSATWIHVVDGEEKNRFGFMINNSDASSPTQTTSIRVSLMRLPLPEYEG